MKKHIITQALLLLATASAQAQNAPAAPSVQDTGASTFVKVDGAPAPTVNPFNGKSLNVEQLQRRLETNKMETQLLEEQLRSVALQEDLKNLPVRKQAEIAQAQTQVAREGAQRAQLEREARAQVDAEEEAKAAAVQKRKDDAIARRDAARREAAEEKRRQEQSSLTSRSTAEAAVAAPQIEVLGVTTVGVKRSALLAINANIASVQDGDATPLGRVSISSSGVVALNGAPLAMQDAAISRVKLSEAAATAPRAASGAATSSTLVIGSQPAVTSTAPAFVPPPVPGSSATPVSARNPMPQLQLPAGVALVPSAR